MAGLDQGLGHRRPAERPAVRTRRKQRLAIDRLPHVGELVGHLADAPHTIGALPFEKSGERRVVAIDEVSEHMHVATVVHGGNFDARHECDSGRRGRGFDFGQRRDGVVIGHAHRPDAGAPREIDEHGRLAEAIGRSRVQVEIDHARRGRGGASWPFVQAGAALCG